MQQTVLTWITSFEDYYFTCRGRSSKTETTWKGDYLKAFKGMPQDEILSADLLTQAAANTPANTRTRRRVCIALGALAKFAGLNVDLKPLKGRYSPPKLTPRNLPDDQTINQWFYKIPDSHWRWAYGMLATYGLRPHELFLLDLEDWSNRSDAITLTDGKTGARRIWPLYPEWVEQFELRHGSRPQVTGATHSDLGHRVAQVFRRLKIPFRAYDLRHCWAVRALEFGLDPSLAAQQMGHSLLLHNTCYQRWISERVHQRAFDALAANPHRPRVPG
jgi:integrase